MNRPIRLGLIGVGAWGSNYVKTVENIHGMEIDLIACKNPNNKSYLQDIYRVVDCWQEVITCPRIDGIIIASPPSTHYEIAAEAIKNKKQLIIEKPITLSSYEAKILLELSVENKVNVKVNHIYLYHPMYIFLKEYIQQKKDLNSIITLSGNFGPFREDVSPLWDWAPHDLAMCLDLMGEIPSKIEAKYNKLEFTSKQNKSNIFTKLSFSNNKYAMLEFGNLMKSKKRFMKLNFANGSYIFDPIRYKHIQKENNFQLEEIEQKKITEDVSFEDSPLEVLLKDFMKDIKINRFKMDDLKLSISVIKTIEQIDMILEKDSSFI